VFTVAGGRITAHREYIDTQAIADAFVTEEGALT
jgi:ketosteroid isomerase-like protein